MQKVRFWNNFAVKVSVKIYLLSFWLIRDAPKEEGGNEFFFLLNGAQTVGSRELNNHCWVLGLRFSDDFKARQLQLFYTKEFQRIIICFFLWLKCLKYSCS